MMYAIAYTYVYTYVYAIAYTYVYTLCAEQWKNVVLLVLALRKINDKTSLPYMN